VKPQVKVFRSLIHHLPLLGYEHPVSYISLWIRLATIAGAWSQQYMIITLKENDDNNSCILPSHKTV
jgi:hypothetical protein